jgi:hypothetical protein
VGPFDLAGLNLLNLEKYLGRWILRGEVLNALAPSLAVRRFWQ